MMEYRFATASDIDALIKSRLEVLRIVNDLEDDYVFGEDFVQASRDYFLKGDQITVFALHDNIIVGCGSIVRSPPCSSSTKAFAEELSSGRIVSVLSPICA